MNASPGEGRARGPVPDDVLMLLDGVGKDYVTEAVTVHALRSVDLTIHRGEFVAIVGQSGSARAR